MIISTITAKPTPTDISPKNPLAVPVDAAPPLVKHVVPLLGRCRLALVLLASLLLDTTTAGEDRTDDETHAGKSVNAQAVREFGSDHSPEIPRGIFIYHNSYIKRPYVVSRAGLTISINDLVVEPGAEWPPFDPTVNSDPGEPPVGSCPWDKPTPGTDRRHGYWSRKTRFLLATLSMADARTAYARLVARCPGVTQVDPDKDQDDAVNVRFADGHVLAIEIGHGEKPMPLTHDQALEDAVQTMKSFVTDLDNGQVVGVLRTFGQWSIDSKDQQRFFAILLSSRTPQDRIAMLAQERFLNPTDAIVVEALTRFDAGGDELYLRFGMVPPSYAGTPAVTGRYPVGGDHNPIAPPLDAGTARTSPLGLPMKAVIIAALLAAIVVVWRLLSRRWS